MREQTRIRLSIIEARYGKRAARAPAEVDRASRFDDDFRRLRDELLSPTLEEIGAAITAAGHGHRIAIDAGEHRPCVELHLLLQCAPPGAINVIRLFTVTGKPPGPEIIAEVQLGRTLVELTRFQEASAITPEIAEQMIVDAVEQVFACNAG